MNMRLRWRLSEETLDKAMRVCIKVSETLNEGDLEMIVDH